MKIGLVDRLGVSFLIVFSMIFGLLSTASAAVTPGTKCTKAGATEIYNGKMYTCIKSASKLIWDKGVKVNPYDATFAAAFLSEAQSQADQILAEAEFNASQISSPPNCGGNNSNASVSIGGDPSTGVTALIYENPGICEQVVRASAEFYCPRGTGGKNTVVSRGTFTLKARTKLFVSLNPERYFPLVTIECRQLTGYTSNTISVNDSITRRHNPTVVVESSRYFGVFNQVAATKKANEILKSAKSRAAKLIADAKNPVIITRAWNKAIVTTAKIAQSKDKATSDAEVAKKKKDTVCPVNGKCEIGNTGPGGGIVFYVAQTPQPWGQYLEVAPMGWSGPGWSATETDPKVEWCVGDYDVWRLELSIKVTDPALKKLIGTAIGTGKANTQLMKTYCSSGAGNLASAYRGGGKEDWFLPSMFELEQLLKCVYYDKNIVKFLFNDVDSSENLDSEMNLTSAANYDNVLDMYWSSSERVATRAWAFRFFYFSPDSDSQYTLFKGFQAKVRPVRAF